MAASSEKPEGKKVDKGDCEGYLSQLVARYNYCVMRHPILTKSVTRCVSAVRICDLHIQVFDVALEMSVTFGVFLPSTDQRSIVFLSRIWPVFPPRDCLNLLLLIVEIP